MLDRGRPTKYENSFCDKIVDFFDIEPTRTTIEKFYYKNGDVKEKEIEVANELPFISEFERENKLGIGRCSKWAKAKYSDNYEKIELRGKYKYPNFRQAYKEAKELQKNMLIKLALKGLYQGAFSIFSAKNMIGWRDKTINEHSGIDGGAILISGNSIKVEKYGDSSKTESE